MSAALHAERHGAGPDLVLLHGWGLHSGVWAEALAPLARRHRVHAIDLPGHGHSAGMDMGSLDDAADAVAAAIPRGARVCGWSLGGLVAQRLARRHPAKAAALVLVGTTPCFVARDDWPHAIDAATLAGFAEGLRDDAPATLARFVHLNALGGAHGREAVRAFTARLAQRGVPPAPALASSLRWLAEADLREEAPRIACPVVVVHGARDRLAPVEAGRWLARRVPRARLVELPDAAHLPFFTHREAFVDAVESLVA